jgi:hypothetical protein
MEAARVAVHTSLLSPAAAPPKADSPMLQWVPENELEEIEVEELKAGELTQHDLAFIGRMAPPPAAE